MVQKAERVAAPEPQQPGRQASRQRHPRHHEPQPHAPRWTAGWPGRRPGGCAPRPTRSSSTSATAPPRPPPSNSSNGSGPSGADVRVCGIEIEPDACAAAKALERPGLSFQLGGFELPVPGNPVAGPRLQRAAAVRGSGRRGIWRLVQDRLAPGRAVHRRHVRRDRPARHVGGAGCRTPAEPEHVRAVRQFRPAVRGGRTAAQSAHPPERARRTDPRDCCRPWTRPGWSRRRWRRSETGSAGRPCAGHCSTADGRFRTDRRGGGSGN